MLTKSPLSRIKNLTTIDEKTVQALQDRLKLNYVEPLRSELKEAAVRAQTYRNNVLLDSK